MRRPNEETAALRLPLAAFPPNSCPIRTHHKLGVPCEPIRSGILDSAPPHGALHQWASAAAAAWGTRRRAGARLRSARLGVGS